jgi:hypothetical protein
VCVCVCVCVCVYMYIWPTLSINIWSIFFYPLQYIAGVVSVFLFHCQLFSHFHHVSRVPLFLTYGNAWNAGALPKATPCHPNKNEWICS